RYIPFILSVDPSFSITMNGISCYLDKAFSSIGVNLSSFPATILSSVEKSNKYFLAE
ncbi:20042_t:CDS:1, partial [Funneliformis geosporum]